MGKNKKKKTEKETSPSFFKELKEYILPYKMKYALSVFISILSVCANMGAFAFAAITVTELFKGNKDITYLGFCIGFTALCKILSAALLNLSTWISHKAAYGTLKDIRLGVTSKMLSLPMGYFEDSGSGRLKTIIVDRIETMEKTLAHFLPEVTANLLAPLAMVVWMFVINGWMGTFLVLWTIVGFSVTGGMMKNYKEKYEGQIKAFKTMNQSVFEYVNGIEVIKNFGLTEKSYEKYKKAVYGHGEYNVNWQKETLSYSALGMAIAPFSVFPTIICGLVLFANGSIEPAGLFLAIILSFSFFGPLMNSMNYFDQLAQMGTNAKEMREILDYPELKRGIETESENCDIEFKNVSFSYKTDGKQALDNINFKIPQGTVFALVGPSGSGKSTIAKLLAGYRDADKGEILIGGKNLCSYSQEALNRMIAYVDQETFLFDGTIKDNVRTGKPDATDEEVINACKLAGCDEFISALPNGYETKSGAAGSRLSGGEKQRIAIARAMMKNAPVMILDEATASSDPENEASIQYALSVAAKGKTLLVVAHRLRTVMNSDCIAYVKDGKIIAMGTHRQLYENCKEYADAFDYSEGR